VVPSGRMPERSERRLSRFLTTCMPGGAPAQVERLSRFSKGGGERGGGSTKECRGEGGAYISASWAASSGAVSAASRWRTLSHWVCVVWREEWRERRMADTGEGGLFASE
jgi:hypothetical protein